MEKEFALPPLEIPYGAFAVGFLATLAVCEATSCEKPEVGQGSHPSADFLRGEPIRALQQVLSDCGLDHQNGIAWTPEDNDPEVASYVLSLGGVGVGEWTCVDSEISRTVHFDEARACETWTAVVYRASQPEEPECGQAAPFQEQKGSLEVQLVVDCNPQICEED